MDKWKKQRWEESQKRREEEDQRRDRVRRKKLQAREEFKSRKSPSLRVSNDLWLRRVESRLAKAGAEPSGQMRDE